MNQWYEHYKAEQQNPELPATFRQWESWYMAQRVKDAMTQMRVWHSVRADAHDHEFTDMPIDALVDHCYTEHVELWNLIGTRDSKPTTWRQEHAHDHGYA